MLCVVQSETVGQCVCVVCSAESYCRAVCVCVCVCVVCSAE